jgi:TPR repeat protein
MKITHLRTLVVLILFFSGPTSFAQSIQYLVQKAHAGDVAAQCNLAYRYAHGQGVEQNYTEAARWYKRAADLGNADAQYNLGYLYDAGRGVSQNYAEAAKWYLKAAKQGNAKAQCNLGVKYAAGQGVQQSYTEASLWYQRAAMQGHPIAQCNLGMMCEKGQGMAQNATEAAKWYSKSAEQDYAIAQCNLGHLYETGNGVTKNYTEAVKWYRKAAEQGESVAQYNLGNCNYYGNGVAKDYAEAVKWYQKAAAQNNENAMNALGILTNKAEPTPKTLAEINWQIPLQPNTDKKDFNIKACINSESRLERLSILVNGEQQRGAIPVSNDGCDFGINQDIALAEGINTIKIIATNAAGEAISERQVTYSPFVANGPTLPVAPSNDNKRLALVIGNANYTDMPLTNPENDATDMANKLQSLDFDVILIKNGNKEQMERAIDDLEEKGRSYNAVMFFYAGHAIQYEGHNYLIPINADITKESDIKYRCTDVNLVLEKMEFSQCEMKIVILDACRNNPFERSWRSGSGQGLSFLNAPSGTFIAYSTSPNRVAYDGRDSRNSPYTEELLKALDKPLSIEAMFKQVREQVLVKTDNQQIPWESTSLTGEFYFVNP